MGPLTKLCPGDVPASLALLGGLTGARCVEIQEPPLRRDPVTLCRVPPMEGVIQSSRGPVGRQTTLAVIPMRQGHREVKHLPK